MCVSVTRGFGVTGVFFAAGVLGDFGVVEPDTVPVFGVSVVDAGVPVDVVVVAFGVLTFGVRGGFVLPAPDAVAVVESEPAVGGVSTGLGFFTTFTFGVFGFDVVLVSEAVVLSVGVTTVALGVFTTFVFGVFGFFTVVDAVPPVVSVVAVVVLTTAGLVIFLILGAFATFVVVFTEVGVGVGACASTPPAIKTTLSKMPKTRANLDVKNLLVKKESFIISSESKFAQLYTRNTLNANKFKDLSCDNFLVAKDLFIVVNDLE